MKLLLIVDDYLPGSIKVAAKMMHDLALELVRSGHEVTVCTCAPALNHAFVLDEFEGVRVVRFRSGVIKNIAKTRRAINETLLSFAAWASLRKYFKENPHDRIVYYSPSIFFGLLVWRLRSLWSCTAFLILRDIFPQWAVDNGLIRKYSPVYFYFKFFEAINYRAATVIAVQSPSNLAYFKDSERHRNKLNVLYNWSSCERKERCEQRYRNMLGLADKTVFFYGGNIGHAQDMMNLIRLAKSLIGFPTAHFLFVGKGDEVELIEGAIREDGLRNVTYLPPVDQNEYEQMLGEFDVGLFSLHKAHITANFPGKLLGYMKHSMPILGSVNWNNDLRETINESKAGFVSINGDDAELTRNATQLVESYQLRREMGANAYKLLCTQFSVEAAASKVSMPERFL